MPAMYSGDTWNSPTRVAMDLRGEMDQTKIDDDDPQDERDRLHEASDDIRKD